MNRQVFQLLPVWLLLSTLLFGCQSKPPRLMNGIEQELGSPQAQAEGKTTSFVIPDSVMNDILSGQLNQPLGMIEEPHYHVVADNIEVRPFFASLVANSPHSVVIHPEVTGTITLDLKDVTLLETIEVLKDIYGFDIGKKGMIYTVKAAGMRIETLTVNYLMMTRSGLSSVSVNAGGVSQSGGGSGGNSSGQSSGQSDGDQSGSSGSSSGGGSQFSGSNIQSVSETDFWQDLKESLDIMVGNEGDRMVIVSPMTGLVTLKALPNEIAAVREFLQRSEQTLRRQVILEAKIVEVSLSDDFQQGINWQQALAHTDGSDFIFANTPGNAANSITAALGGISSIRFNNKDFTGVITLLETQGNVQVLSSPRVTATNNQKAVIKVGQDEYFVTDVSSTTTTGAATTTTPELTLTPFFSGIALDVTPQIDEHGEVILHIHPSVTETSEQEKVVTLSGETIVLPLAQSNIRESDTIIRAASGEIVVIGGLMQSSITDTSSKTPFFGDIPLLGHLFKQTKEVERKKELVILVRATVVGAGTWKQQLKRSSDLLKTWYSVQ
ncbi:MAG: MSHA biogenesis protein MshL [Alteromonadaceae bacterium]|jgi:MSHA biogenesis protein MshL